jgi:hypothetical protein
MKPCCPAFGGWLKTAGKRGIGIFVDDSGYEDIGPMFILQFRAVDHGVTLPPITSADEKTLISMTVDVALQYCPWCGRNLGKWYKSDWRDMLRPELRTPLGGKD